MLNKIFLICSIALLIVAISIYSDINVKNPVVSLSGFARLIEPAKKINKFELRQSNNRIFLNQSLKGKWSFVFLGYTHCPDICPTTLARFSTIYPQLKELTTVQLVFVSVDPLRDNVDDLNAYVTYFSEEFLGVTANHDALYPFTQSLYLPYTIVAEKKFNQYSVGHSAAIALINPQGHFQAIFKPSYNVGEIPVVDMDQLVKDFEIILNQVEPN